MDDQNDFMPESGRPDEGGFDYLARNIEWPPGCDLQSVAKVRLPSWLEDGSVHVGQVDWRNAIADALQVKFGCRPISIGRTPPRELLRLFFVAAADCEANQDLLVWARDMSEALFIWTERYEDWPMQEPDRIFEVPLERPKIAGALEWHEDVREDRSYRLFRLLSRSANMKEKIAR